MKTVLHIFAMAVLLAGSGTEVFAAAPVRKDGKEKAPEVLTLHGGVLINPVEKAIFVAKTEGGIEAIDSATGNTLWQTPKEGGMRWPVAVHGRTLVVRVRDKPLRIAGLDLDAKGKVLWTTEPVLPEAVRGPEWLEDKPGRNRAVREWVPAEQREKVGVPNPNELDLAFLARLKGTYRCEERIEKGELVMRWRATTHPLDPPAREASGVVVVDLKTGKFRTRPLEKDWQIEEKHPLPTVEWQGIELSVAESLHVGNWVKTLPASRSIVEARLLRAVDKKTNKLLWERTLRKSGYTETRLVNGG